MVDTVDLRSDLLAPRSKAVAQAVADAFSDPPTLNPGENPYEQQLISHVCDLLGKEDGVFLPTCTMANQIAVRCWLPSGGALVADGLSHVFTIEYSALKLTGVTTQALASENGHITPDAVGAFFDQDAPKSSLIWLENTHNLAGGTVMPQGWQEQIGHRCALASTPLHLDGSRLWNAAAASDVELAATAKGAASVALSLNKSVGAPMGAILAGPKDMIGKAVKLRAAMSGDWRPIGPMAAGAIASLDQWRRRLQRDHGIAAELSAALKLRLGADAVSNPTTNIILLYCPDAKAAEIVAVASRHGVKVLAIGASMIRLVVHGGVTQDSLPPVVDGLTAAWDEVLDMADPDTDESPARRENSAA